MTKRFPWDWHAEGLRVHWTIGKKAERKDGDGNDQWPKLVLPISSIVPLIFHLSYFPLTERCSRLKCAVEMGNEWSLLYTFISSPALEASWTVVGSYMGIGNFPLEARTDLVNEGVLATLQIS